MDGEVGDRNRKIKKEEEEESGNSSTSAARANFQQFLPFFSLSLSLAFEEKSICLPIFPLLPIQDPPTFPEKKEENKP